MSSRQSAREVARLIGLAHYQFGDHYLTSEINVHRLLDGAIPTALDAAGRRIEAARARGRRLIGLASFWVGSANGVPRTIQG